MNTTKTAQFTPGPWEVTGPNTCEVVTSNAGTYRPIMTIAKVNGYWDGEALANMRLIAAAPVMYEALQDIENFAELGLNSGKPEHLAAALADIMQTGREALAQAEGR